VILESVVAADIESADLRMAAIPWDVISAGADVSNGEGGTGQRCRLEKRRPGRALPGRR
jgi:hypothetical protein